MAKYVPDIKTQRWVIISQSRLNRPDDSRPVEKVPKSKVCPFCEGNEHLTPPEVYRLGTGEKDKPGWSVRVVPNKFPITDIHEVIIHSPNCEDNIEKLPLEQVVRIVTVYRDRYQAHENDGQVIIFCNQGLHAGASLKHPHAQLVVVPRQINLDAVSLEPKNNIVEENTYFITYCPDFSQWPYEVWISPKVAGGKFSEINSKEIADFAEVLQLALKRLAAVYQMTSVFRDAIPFGYNYYIHHGPQWFIRIIPRFVHRAGFELGTGLNVNVVDPTDAAEHLKQV